MKLPMKQKFCIPILAVLVLAGWFLATGEDPNRTNVISTEQEPLKAAVLPVSEAFTLALTRDASGQSIPLLVTALAGGKVRAVDLSQQGAFRDADLFQAIENVGEHRLRELFQQAHATSGSDLTQEYTFDQLLSVAGQSQRHVASGTNFREHLEETRSQSVFSFPKFGLPTPPVTTVNLHDGVLLDYEVEMCMRFDRDLLTVQDFDAAQKGIFLCADFTNRALLSRMVDVDNFDSGSGFSDAKSGPGFFPTGGLLIVPKTWKTFVDAERIITLRNDALRQDARGNEMILDFRQLTEKVLADATSTRFIYDGQNHLLIENGMIAKGQVLMSGTPEGVTFMPPTTRQLARGIARYLFTGGFLSGKSGYDSTVESFIQEELASLRYLQPDERIEYQSSSMGSINARVVSASAAR